MSFEDIHEGMVLNFQYRDDPWIVLEKTDTHFRLQQLSTGSFYNLPADHAWYFMPHPHPELYQIK